MAVTNASGTVVESYSYKPYGAVTIKDHNGSEISATRIEQPWMYTGRRLDFEEGGSLYYYRLRYYDPESGRFVSRDPIGLWGDAGNRGNGQNYCGNNPVNRVDPFGDWSPGDSTDPTLFVSYRDLQDNAWAHMQEIVNRHHGNREAASSDPAYQAHLATYQAYGALLESLIRTGARDHGIVGDCTFLLIPGAIGAGFVRGGIRGGVGAAFNEWKDWLWDLATGGALPGRKRPSAGGVGRRLDGRPPTHTPEAPPPKTTSQPAPATPQPQPQTGGQQRKLRRYGADYEDAKELNRQARLSEKQGWTGNRHGVSATTSRRASGSKVSKANRAEVEEHFPVHETPTIMDPHHVTIELPKPVTDEVAETFNRLFGR